MAQIKIRLIDIVAYLLPSFVGLYTVLNFLETNITEAGPSDITLLASIVVIFGFALSVFFNLVGLSTLKSALVSTITMIIVIFGTILFRILNYFLNGEFSYPVFSGLIVVFLTLIFFGLKRAKSTFEPLVQVLAIVVVVGIGIATSNIILYEINRSNLDFPEAVDLGHIDKKNDPIGQKRNIFYIILDRYGDQRTLTANYNFDNSDFTSALRQNGFFVADQSSSNYPFTAQSLSSSLNMEYHRFAEEQTLGYKDDWIPFIRLLKENRVTEFLQNVGYTYVHMGSWWGPTETSPLADENFRTTKLGQIDSKFLLRTLIAPLLFINHDEESKGSIAPSQCSRVSRKLSRLADLASSEEPTFVFAHFLVPHDPFVFDENGHCQSLKDVKGQTLKQLYLGQLQYANKFLLSLVDTLLSQPGPKPIIIIQADEGPYPKRYRTDQKAFQWLKATDKEVQQKMRILNAYYFPETDQQIFYHQITPVNSFRLLFNRYFGMNLPLLPDRNYASPSDSNRYDFFEVTDIVR